MLTGKAPEHFSQPQWKQQVPQLHRLSSAGALEGPQKVGQAGTAEPCGEKEGGDGGRWQRWGQASAAGQGNRGGQGLGEQGGSPLRPYLVLTVDLGPRVDQDLEDL